MTKYSFLLGFLFFNLISVAAQNNRTEGKIIKGYGATFTIDNPEIITDTTATLKVIFDVSKTATKNSDINSNLVTAARFLNMHAESGMDLKQLKVAITIHGAAWKDVINDDLYLEKYGTKNPNTELLKQLNEAGVNIIICGQTAAFREIDRSTVNSNVKFALSAMTALLQYQNNGYHFIKF
ncbi:hypothetical protein FBALC1_10732 [Flavobacteriales bacterium ALC-1]|nr:hypothetical protein FBALC1_10732 [Flavobacteriales bacterium ALC-1]